MLDLLLSCIAMLYWCLSIINSPQRCSIHKNIDHTAKGARYDKKDTALECGLLYTTIHSSSTLTSLKNGSHHSGQISSGCMAQLRSHNQKSVGSQNKQKTDKLPTVLHTIHMQSICLSGAEGQGHYKVQVLSSEGAHELHRAIDQTSEGKLCAQ